MAAEALIDDASTAGPAPAVKEPLRRGRPAALLKRTPFLPTLLSGAVLLGLWEVAARQELISGILFGSPSGVAESAVQQMADPAFWGHAWLSVSQLSIGFILAVIVGTAVGLLAGMSRIAGYMLGPWFDAFNATPRIALLPLIVLWFGIGAASKITLIFLCGVGLVALNVFSGVRSMDKGLLVVADAFHTPALRRFTSIIAPCALPFILSGARLALGAAVVGVVFAESSGSSAGLGYVMSNATQQLDVNKFFFVVLVLTAVGFAYFSVLGILEKHLRWQPSPRD